MLDTSDVGDRVLGRYRLVRRIAVGGMGDIFLARTEGDAGFVRPVVIKQVRPQLLTDAGAVGMFEREARINARLAHPHIVDVLDFRRERGAHLMVLAYVRGVSLAAWLRFHREGQRAMAPEIAVHVAAQTLEALAAVHGLVGADGEPAPVIHRDISPSNLLVSVDGHVKLMDFGIARLVEPSDPDEYATQTYAIKGKVAYLPPEVLDGAPATARSDLYSVGVVLHEMLAGRNERSGGGLPEVLTRVLTQPLTPLSELRSDVPPALSALVAQATARSPAERPASADTFRDALLAALPLAGGGAGRTRAQLDADLGTAAMRTQLGALHPSELDQAWRDFEPDALTELDLKLASDVSEPSDSEPGEPGHPVPPWGPPPFRRATPAAAAGAGPAASADAAPARPDPAAAGSPLLPLETLAEQTARLQAPRPNHLARHAPGGPLELDWGEAGPPTAAEPEETRRRRRPRVLLVAGLIGAAVLAGALEGVRRRAWAPSSAQSPSGELRSGANRPPRGPGAGVATGSPDHHQRFEAQRHRLDACVRAHGLPARDQRDARFQFEVDGQGDVQSARVSPPGLAARPLGQCLRKTARGFTLAAGEPGRFEVVLSLD